MKRGRLRQVSSKALARRSERADIRFEVHGRDRVCQFPNYVSVAYMNSFSPLPPSFECGGRLDVHEIIPRSAWAEGQYDLDNCVLVCRAHHQWIDNNPALAHDIGLHKFSWERAT